MADENRRSGILFVKVDGVQRDIIGDWTYNFGGPKREAEMGPDRVHGYKETVQNPFVEGEIRDARGLSVVELINITNSTITMELANGKVFVLRQAWWAADGDIGTEEANIQARFEGLSAEEV